MKEETIKLLKTKQETLVEAQAKLSKKRYEFDEMNAGLIEEIRILTDSFETTKSEIKTEAIETFKETGEKKLLGGIGIRILTKLSYSEDTAIEWARKNMPVAIIEIINKKQFETYAKSTGLNFVTQRESVTVTFPKEIKI